MFLLKIMEGPKQEESFEIGELGVEVLNEWYAERGLVGVETEPKPKKMKEIQIPKDNAPEIEEVSEVPEEQEKRDLIKGKLKELLDIGEEKGLSYAIKIARRSNDPFLLDVFHDILARDGNYKKILKK